jgi:hypothetical protein
MDLGRIELPPPQCECGVLPLYYRPIGHGRLSYCHCPCPRAESNSHPELRSLLFYPLNYGGLILFAIFCFLINRL